MLCLGWHERVIIEESHENGTLEKPLQAIAWLLIPLDQKGCVIEKGGQIIQNTHSESQSQIKTLGSELCRLAF